MSTPGAEINRDKKIPPPLPARSGRSDARHGVVIAMLQWPHDKPGNVKHFCNSEKEISLADVVCELCLEMVANESISVPST